MTGIFCTSNETLLRKHLENVKKLYTLRHLLGSAWPSLTSFPHTEEGGHVSMLPPPLQRRSQFAISPKVTQQLRLSGIHTQLSSK